jgi:hypothetical protein
MEKIDRGDRLNATRLVNVARLNGVSRDCDRTYYI